MTFPSLYSSVNLVKRSRATSEPASMAWSTRWSIRSHRLIYQWIWSNVHVQLVSLLQWRAESWPLRWASQLVSLLQWQITFDSKLQTYELVPTSNQQWACFNGTIIFGNKSIHELVPTPNLHSEPATISISILQG